MHTRLFKAAGSFLLAFGACVSISSAQAAGCDKLMLDLDQGTLNGIGLKATLDQVKKAFPCKPDESKNMEGVNLYFGDQSFDILVGHSITVFNIDAPFKGTLSKDILGKPAEVVETAMGAPVYTAREEADQETHSFFQYYFYERPWGTLIVKFNYFQPAMVEEITLTRDNLEKVKKQFPADADVEQ